jgi:hypothetical protein
MNTRPVLRPPPERERIQWRRGRYLDLMEDQRDADVALQDLGRDLRRAEADLRDELARIATGHPPLSCDWQARTKRYIAMTNDMIAKVEQHRATLPPHVFRRR